MNQHAGPGAFLVRFVLTRPGGVVEPVIHI